MLRQMRNRSLHAILWGFLLISLILNLPRLSNSGSASTSLRAAGSQSNPATLLFTIGMHIEPFGATLSPLVGGGPPPNAQGPNYNNSAFFQRHVQDIETLMSIIERHGGRMTIQAQTPFTRVAAQSGETILADLEARGHEIGLHFHEDAHLGRNPESLPVETWAAVLNEEIGYIYQAGVKNHVRYWSGGNLYPGILDAASRAGLDVQSDWKNPRTQNTEAVLLGVNPWRPAEGPSETDVSGYAQHDPAGKIIFLPEGNYSRTDFASARRSGEFGGDEGYFDFLKGEFQRSLDAAQPDRVNVFHFTVHAGEFRGSNNQPFSVIDRWLTEMIDPLVQAGRVRWATFSEMADAFKAWEQTHPSVDPRGVAASQISTLKSELLELEDSQAESTNPSAVAAQMPHGYMTFAVNVHDFRNLNESADTLLRLISIFEKYGVRGDFYLTAPMVESYARQRPEVIARLKDSGMTISYHVRPPHALYQGFDQPLRGLSGQALTDVLRNYETYKLDLATGGLLRDQPGGYLYVAQTFGRAPVVVGAPNNNQNIKTAAFQLYKELGAQMAVNYHECCADPDQPFEYRDGLLARPSDFSVTRWSVTGGPTDAFWWNMLESRYAAQYNPTSYLTAQVVAWQGNRPPFITSLIHENNFYRRGPESWTLIYYSDRDKTRPLSPPFDLNAPDLSRPRSFEEQEAIWAAYEQMVAYAAANLRVVTSEEIVALAQAERTASSARLEVAAGAPTRPASESGPGTTPSGTTQTGQVDRDITYCTADGVPLKMDIYYPTNANSPASVAMYVHGGGWTSGDKSQGAGTRDISELVSRGYLVTAINYRLAPQYQFPAQIEDCKCAVRFLRANAAQYNLDPNRIGVWGSSAGGHLVALLGLTDESAGFEGSGDYADQSSRVQAVVDMFGPTDLTQLFNGANPRLLEQVFGTSDRHSEAIQRASPVTWVTSDDPPFLMLHGELDDLVPPSQSQILYDRLVAASVPATLVFVENAGHGFAPVGGSTSPTRQELTRMIADFFDRYLK